MPTKITTSVTSLARRKRRSVPRVACWLVSSPRAAWDATGGWSKRTLSWLNRFRYEHRADIHRAFLQLCCDLISSRFPRLTTSNPRERSAWTAAHGICSTRDMTIKRLDHVSVVVDDLAAAALFSPRSA